MLLPSAIALKPSSHVPLPLRRGFTWPLSHVRTGRTRNEKIRKTTVPVLCEKSSTPCAVSGKQNEQFRYAGGGGEEQANKTNNSIARSEGAEWRHSVKQNKQFGWAGQATIGVPRQDPAGAVVVMDGMDGGGGGWMGLLDA